MLEETERDAEGRRIHLLSRGHLEGALDLDRWVAAASGERFSGRRVVLDGRPAVAKGGLVAGSARRRHGLSQALLGTPPPAAREFRHLEWMRARLFRAPEPLLAVTVGPRLGPIGQVLVTAEIEGVRALDVAWEDVPQRDGLALELGTELGRLHALRFLHGDVYARNLLVTPHPEPRGPGAGRRIVFLDAWMGGPTAWRRGTLQRLERDLGCLVCDVDGWMSRDHQGALLRAYLDGRASNGRPLQDLPRWLRRVRAARTSEVRRLLRRPARLRGAAPPSAEWEMELADLADGTRADRRQIQ